ncbi:DNA-binding MarR family transcriptional regulator [Luteibacter sp. Sphag1AF]|uniref:MarR family winged helix-turn-helix transcriptional regulator n=1 Tax=Luteibacter sp. Sphag1AF TaxID=2587031 RepID=UPI001847080D|nr:MarR family transcriptional regulator [Luteibacter sp. Sphag1AF]MBB3229103.1 DNA-binding MarR family transcriptional regulator [Luteibacter sp. Sphag1AF]
MTPPTPALPMLAADLRTVLGHMKRRLREQANMGDLTLSQLAVLGHLDRTGPATVTMLARAEGVRPQSMGATVAVLLEAGLVAGTPDPADGRQTILDVTAHCRDLIEASRVTRDDWLVSRIRSELSPEEQQQLTDAVDLLKRIVDV